MDFLEKVGNDLEWFPFGPKGIIAFGLGASFFLVLVFGPMVFGFGLLGLLLGLMAYGIFAYFLSVFLKSRHQRQMELMVPLVLAKASLLQQGPRYDQLIEMICDPLYEPLSNVFKRVRGRLRSGSSFSQALRDESAGESSFLIRRMLILLAHGFDAGVDLRVVLSDTARYTRERFSQRDEVESESWVEKMTLLISAGLLIPFMSGSLMGLSILPLGEENSIEGDWGFSTNQELAKAVQSGVELLRWELLVIASLLAAFLEGKPSKAVLYLAILGPVSQIIFFMANQTG